MLMTNLNAMTGLLLIMNLMIGEVEPAQPAPALVNLTADTLAPLHKQIRPQPGESRWMDIPWFLDLHEARQKAAAEGKPLFIYSSGGATGIGAC